MIGIESFFDVHDASRVPKLKSIMKQS